MESPLHNIQGKAVSKVVKIHDYIQLFFEGGWGLNIYNPFHFTSEKFSSIDDLAGLRVTSTKDDTSVASIHFSDGSSVSIRLDDDAYTGPEAMDLRGPGDKFFVWN